MSKEILDPEAISKASDLVIYGAKGEEVRFGSLFEHNKTVVVFIRHFFCGFCQAYTTHLSQVPQNALDEAGIKIAVVGCGEWAAIQGYADTTKFSGPIYADPSRKLYHSLGMTIESLATTPSGQEKRSYLPSSFLSNMMQSIWKGPLQHPTLIGKQGNISQLGGEFIFGPGNSCSFASRMQHTDDHIEVADLMAAAGVKYS